MTEQEKNTLIYHMWSMGVAKEEILKKIPIMYYFKKELITVRGDFDSIKNGDFVFVQDLEETEIDICKITWNTKEKDINKIDSQEWELNKITYMEF